MCNILCLITPALLLKGQFSILQSVLQRATTILHPKFFMLPPPTGDSKLPQWSPTSWLEWQCFGAEKDKMWLQKEEMLNQMRSNITWPGLLNLITQIYIYFRSLHPLQIPQMTKEWKTILLLPQSLPIPA